MAGGDEGTPILDLIGSGDVRLVVNTPTPQSGPVRDAAEIRLAEVRSLREWVPEAPSWIPRDVGVAAVV